MHSLRTKEKTEQEKLVTWYFTQVSQVRSKDDMPALPDNIFTPDIDSDVSPEGDVKNSLIDYFTKNLIVHSKRFSFNETDFNLTSEKDREDAVRKGLSILNDSTFQGDFYWLLKQFKSYPNLQKRLTNNYFHYIWESFIKETHCKQAVVGIFSFLRSLVHIESNHNDLSNLITIDWDAMYRIYTKDSLDESLSVMYSELCYSNVRFIECESKEKFCQMIEDIAKNNLPTDNSESIPDYLFHIKMLKLFVQSRFDHHEFKACWCEVVGKLFHIYTNNTDSGEVHDYANRRMTLGIDATKHRSYTVAERDGPLSFMLSCLSQTEYDHLCLATYMQRLENRDPVMYKEKMIQLRDEMTPEILNELSVLARDLWDWAEYGEADQDNYYHFLIAGAKSAFFGFSDECMDVLRTLCALY